jgi:hypothetical protein
MTSWHGPHRKHLSYVDIYGPLSSNGHCIFITLSLRSNRSACHNKNPRVLTVSSAEGEMHGTVLPFPHTSSWRPV